MASASTYRPPLTTRQLLVSVQNADEAALAFQCGVPWVDLKNPSAGALGQPTADTCQEFMQVATAYSSSHISVALGEYETVDWDWASNWLSPFSVGKVGLAGRSSIDDSVRKQLARFAGRIVPALYADWQQAGSAPPESVVRLARDIRAPFMLIDTYMKDGRGLFDWLTVSMVQELQLQIQSFGADLVIAGSLRTTDWAKLEQLDNITIGVRGAVCETSVDRTSCLSQSAVRQWLKWTGLS